MSVPVSITRASLLFATCFLILFTGKLVNADCSQSSSGKYVSYVYEPWSDEYYGSQTFLRINLNMNCGNVDTENPGLNYVAFELPNNLAQNNDLINYDPIDGSGLQYDGGMDPWATDPFTSLKISDVTNQGGAFGSGEFGYSIPTSKFMAMSSFRVQAKCEAESPVTFTLGLDGCAAPGVPSEVPSEVPS